MKPKTKTPDLPAAAARGQWEPTSSQFTEARRLLRVAIKNACKRNKDERKGWEKPQGGWEYLSESRSELWRKWPNAILKNGRPDVSRLKQARASVAFKWDPQQHLFIFIRRRYTDKAEMERLIEESEGHVLVWRALQDTGAKVDVILAQVQRPDGARLREVPRRVEVRKRDHADAQVRFAHTVLEHAWN